MRIASSKNVFNVFFGLGQDNKLGSNRLSGFDRRNTERMVDFDREKS